MAKDDGGPAFPGGSNGSEFDGRRNEYVVQTYTGMSLRQWYAGMAMQGLLANTDFIYHSIAKISFAVADSMLKFEEEENNGK